MSAISSISTIKSPRDSADDLYGPLHRPDSDTRLVAEVLEVFEILKDPETSSRVGESHIPRTARRDKIFKTVILASLLASIMVQILVLVRLHNKLKVLESHLSLYPINQPERVGLSETLPEIVTLDRNIDLLTERLNRYIKSRQALRAPKENTESETRSTPIRKEGKRRRSNHVEIIEEVNN